MRNKKALVLLVFACIFIQLKAQDYTLIFSEEFDNPTLDPLKWNIESGYASNQEKQYYSTGYQNIRIEGGNLILTGRKEQAEVTDRFYTSGRVNTKGKGFIKYGKVEARISLPAGAGTWPAFWMMPESNTYGSWPKSGEIDIMEHIGSNPTMISHAVHTANKNGSAGNNWFNRQTLTTAENNFHTYSIIWGPDDIKFYIDDVKSVTLYRNFAEDYKGWPFNQNFYVILNLALGGTMGGTINDAIFNNPVEMKVDYLHIYQLATGLEGTKVQGFEVESTHFTNEIIIHTDKITNIELFNGFGKQICKKTVNGSGSILTNNLPKGLYLLRSNNHTIKLIK